jgi:hypothetical protein
MGLRALNPTPNEGLIAEVHAKLCPFTRKPRVDGARLGWLGIGACKYFGILVGGEGEGCQDRVIGSSGDPVIGKGNTPPPSRAKG